MAAEADVRQFLNQNPLVADSIRKCLSAIPGLNDHMPDYLAVSTPEEQSVLNKLLVQHNQAIQRGEQARENELRHAITEHMQQIIARDNAAAAAQQSYRSENDRVTWVSAREKVTPQPQQGAAVRRKLTKSLAAATEQSPKPAEQTTAVMAEQVKAQPGDENLPVAKVVEKGNASTQQQEPAKPAVPKPSAASTKRPPLFNPEWTAAQERAAKLKAAAMPAPEASTAPKPGSKSTG